MAAAPAWTQTDPHPGGVVGGVRHLRWFDLPDESPHLSVRTAPAPAGLVDIDAPGRTRDRIAQFDRSAMYLVYSPFREPQRPGDGDHGGTWSRQVVSRRSNLAFRMIPPASFTKMVNHESGLLGVSETSSDMRDLLEHESGCAGSGSCGAVIRRRSGSVCRGARWIGHTRLRRRHRRKCARRPLTHREGLGFLGIEVNESRNAASAAVISEHASRVTVRVIRTDEELMIARVGQFLPGGHSERRETK